MTRLLDARAKIEAKRTTGQTAVHIAAYLGHVAMLEHLHARGAKMEPTKKKGSNAFSPEALAVSAGHAEVLAFVRGERKATLDQGAALAAVQASHVSLLEEVLGREITIGPPEKRRYELAHDAVREGHIPIVEFLVQGPMGLSAWPSTGSLMQLAAHAGHSAIIEYLAQKGVDIEAGGKGNQPLLSAALKGNGTAVGKMLQLRADIGAQDQNNLTALHLAVLRGNADIADQLLKGRASMEHKEPEGNETGRQHLHVAAAIGHTKMMEVLINHRADVEVEDLGGSVPLFMAAERGNVGAMKLLVSRRADLYRKVKMPRNSSENDRQNEYDCYRDA